MGGPTEQPVRDARIPHICGDPDSIVSFPTCLGSIDSQDSLNNDCAGSGVPLASYNKFKIVLEKQHSRGLLYTQLGMQLAKRSEGLAVVSLAGPGELVREWNRKHPKSRVQHGDVITKVNGVGGCGYRSADVMLKEIRDAEQLILSVLRAPVYRITVNKTGTLGLDFNKFDCNVVGVDEGIIRDYNVACGGQFMVAHGDTLVEVNGKAGTPHELLQKIEDATGLVSMSFKRWQP